MRVLQIVSCGSVTNSVHGGSVTNSVHGESVTSSVHSGSVSIKNNKKGKKYSFNDFYM